MSHYNYAFNILYFPLKCFPVTDRTTEYANNQKLSKDLKVHIGNSLAGQWLELGAFNCRGPRFEPWLGN